MIKLYYGPNTCSMSEHIVLEWIGEEYEAIKSDYSDPEFLKINPKGAVPAMQDGDGPIMTQNDALLNYLAQKFPKTQLAGDNSLEQTYQVNHWLAYVGSDLHPAFKPLFSVERYTIKEDEESLEAVKEAAKKRIDVELAHLEKGLEGRDYLVTNKPTIADAYAFVVSRWYESTTGKDFLKNFPNIATFRERMMEDKSVAKVVGVHNPSNEG